MRARASLAVREKVRSNECPRLRHGPIPWRQEPPTGRQRAPAAHPASWSEQTRCARSLSSVLRSTPPVVRKANRSISNNTFPAPNRQGASGEELATRPSAGTKGSGPVSARRRSAEAQEPSVAMRGQKASERRRTSPAETRRRLDPVARAPCAGSEAVLGSRVQRRERAREGRHDCYETSGRSKRSSADGSCDRAARTPTFNKPRSAVEHCGATQPGSAPCPAQGLQALARGRRTCWSLLNQIPQQAHWLLPPRARLRPRAHDLSGPRARPWSKKARPVGTKDGL